LPCLALPCKSASKQVNLINTGKRKQASKHGVKFCKYLQVLACLQVQYINGLLNMCISIALQKYSALAVAHADGCFVPHS